MFNKQILPGKNNKIKLCLLYGMSDAKIRAKVKKREYNNDVQWLEHVIDSVAHCHCIYLIVTMVSTNFVGTSLLTLHRLEYVIDSTIHYTYLIETAISTNFVGTSLLALQWC